MEYLPAFCVTYHSFTTCEELLRKVIERYNVPSTKNFSKEEVNAIKLLCEQVLLLITTKYYHGLTKEFELSLTDFIDTNLSESAMAKKIRMAILNRVKKKKQFFY